MKKKYYRFKLYHIQLAGFTGFLLLFFPLLSFPQYFGQNKVNYEQFQFKINKTPHFDIYNYLENDSLMKSLSNQAEQWYSRHHALFGDTIVSNPLIIYNDKADFKQTNVISGQIGVGTGGVTEGLRRRVIMPILNSSKETDHVMGHELVHVFQYFMFQNEDSLSYQNLQNVPLWMIEGMAEYLSIGVRDNQTAMWMRDAVMQDDVPSIKDMTRKQYEYFPYRYGHAFWAFFTGTWGDVALKPFFYHTALSGIEQASKRVTGISADSLSTLWQKSVKDTYYDYVKDSIKAVGQPLFNQHDYGKINLAPVLSPDGKYVAFLTNKNVISIDMLMAEVKTGKIVKKLTGPVSQSHIDDFNYIESAGSWSPDGNQYVVTSFSGGRNIMLLIKLDGNRITEKEIRFKDIQSFNNPEWSPDGKKIVFSGLVKGLSDLFLYDIEKDEVEKITHDFYSDLQPSWSSDGQHIVFISDRGPDTDFSRQLFGNYRLSIYDMATDSITVIQDVFPASEVFSPYYIRQDSSLLFLSHADGFRNLYRYDLYTDSLFRMTRFPTGIAGITDLAPAFSVSCQTQELVYTLYHHDGYHLYKASLDDFEYEPVSKNMLNTRPEHLPPVDRVMNVVEQNLHKHPQTGDSSMTLLPYKPKLELEYIGSGGFGVATGAYDTYASGGVNALFGDVLKRHELYTLFMLQGELYDAGGGATYINREQRFNWGLSLFHIPYRYAYYNYDPNIFYDGDPYDSITIVQQRIFQDQLAFFGQYPFSKKIRIEAGGYLTRYSYRVDSITDMYYWGAYTGQVKRRGDAPDADFIPKIYTAFVGDDVDFGVTCPLDGYRFRLQIDHSFADLRQFTTLVDLRRYKYFKPFSAGLRLLHYARYGRDANKLYPMYLGNNYFIRGYAYSSFADNYLVTEDSFNPNSIMGSRMALFNAELRLPFTGPERLAMIKSGYLFSDLVLFADGGFSTYSYSEIDWGWNANPEKYNVVYSAGLAMRINLFGYAIIEPYVARPFQRTDKEYVFGLFLKGMDW